MHNIVPHISVLDLCRMKFILCDLGLINDCNILCPFLYHNNLIKRSIQTHVALHMEY